MQNLFCGSYEFAKLLSLKWIYKRGKMKLKTFKLALTYTMPICAGFLFLGISYGFLMQSKGFSFVYPMLTSFFVFAGSMEFVTADLLLEPFNPLHAFILTLIVNARHIFYGISMLKKYANTGKIKPYLIFGMCDESFSINCTTRLPDDVDKTLFMFFVTFLNHIWWVLGSTIGGLLGYVIHFNTKGIDFVLTALFVTLFVNQWNESKNHNPALAGLFSALICLLIFGPEGFVIPSMFLILLYFLTDKKQLARRVECR